MENSIQSMRLQKKSILYTIFSNCLLTFSKLSHFFPPKLYTQFPNLRTQNAPHDPLQNVTLFSKYHKRMSEWSICIKWQTLQFLIFPVNTAVLNLKLVGLSYAYISIFNTIFYSDGNLLRVATSHCKHQRNVETENIY